MALQGQSNFDHGSDEKIGVLITNLGTPTAPTKGALRAYLKQFLSDSRVVEIPKLVWWFILNGIILNTRPAKSAELYASVWTERGSPLRWHTEDQANAIAQRLQAELGEAKASRIIVKYAMRYGQPSIAEQMQSLQEAGASKIVVLPLYPQYASSTTGSTFDALSEYLCSARWLPELRFIANYHDNPAYIRACAAQIKQHWEKNGRAEKLLFSFHGLPKFHMEKGDPYHCHCHKTVRLIIAELGIDAEQTITTFQSRFGRTEWLKPYTDETLKGLPGQGVKSLDVFCPGFSADCLETLEEIAGENREYFIEAGGTEYHYIPALNSAEPHIAALTQIVQSNLQEWLQIEPRDASLCKHQAQIKKDNYPV